MYGVDVNISRGVVFMAMRRTQISLPEDLKRKVEKRAKQEGISLAEILRRALVPYLVISRGRPDFKVWLQRTAGMWRTRKDIPSGRVFAARLRRESDKRMDS